MITPYFGFETVPAMVEEGDFPIKDQKKAILGSVLTCGAIYTILLFLYGRCYAMGRNDPTTETVPRSSHLMR